MRWRNTVETYGAIAKTVHWLIALAIITMLIMGFVMDAMPLSPQKLQVYGLHKATGIVILGLVVLRLLWRFTNPTPKLPADMPWIERMAAHAGHAGLYLLMIGMPLSGWLMSSAAGFPVSVYGLFQMPDLVVTNQELRKQMGDVHGTLAWVIIGLVSVHVLAALFHHFYHKDTVLRRMLPWGNRQ